MLSVDEARSLLTLRLRFLTYLTTKLYNISFRAYNASNILTILNFRGAEIRNPTYGDARRRIYLCPTSHHAFAAELVGAYFKVAEPFGTEKVSSLPGQRGRGFDNDVSSGSQAAACDAGNGAVEAQRVVVGYKEREMGFVVEDGAAHLVGLAVTDIRGIGDNKVKSLILGPSAIQHVSLYEGHVAGAEVRGVGLCDVQGCVADVNTRHLGRGES